MPVEVIKIRTYSHPMVVEKSLHASNIVAAFGVVADVTFCGGISTGIGATLSAHALFAPLELGLREGLKGGSVEIVAVFSADTGLRQQLNAVEEAFASVPDIDLLIGSAPAVEAIIGLREVTGLYTNVELVSTYISHTIKRSILNERVLAVPFDDPVQQGELALKQALRVLQTGRKEGLAGPEIRLFNHKESSKMTAPLSPSVFFRKFSSLHYRFATALG
ncbi:hypothetical protein [Pseudophaeobacter sp.]|uniref:hypothetical protein n=1 Tax=Pseudophaeobacter sp. TaxID=1971739 RepID=UPI00329899E6